MFTVNKSFTVKNKKWLAIKSKAFASLLFFPFIPLVLHSSLWKILMEVHLKDNYKNLLSLEKKIDIIV